MPTDILLSIPVLEWTRLLLTSIADYRYTLATGLDGSIYIAISTRGYFLCGDEPF